MFRWKINKKDGRETGYQTWVADAVYSTHISGEVAEIAKNWTTYIQKKPKVDSEKYETEILDDFVAAQESTKTAVEGYASIPFAAKVVATGFGWIRVDGKKDVTGFDEMYDTIKRFVNPSINPDEPIDTSKLKKAVNTYLDKIFYNYFNYPDRFRFNVSGKKCAAMAFNCMGVKDKNQKDGRTAKKLKIASRYDAFREFCKWACLWADYEWYDDKETHDTFTVTCNGLADVPDLPANAAEASAEAPAET